MKKIPTPKKYPAKASKESKKTLYKASKSSQKHVRKYDPSHRAQSILRRTISNLKQMAGVIKSGKKVTDYEVLASQLSAIAGLHNGHVWGWRYIASVLSGSIVPGKKFIDAVALYNEKINPRKKEYFYFVRRHSFIMIYEKSCLREIVKSHMKERNYKLVTFKKYMQVKKSMSDSAKAERMKRGK